MNMLPACAAAHLSNMSMRLPSSISAGVWTTLSLQYHFNTAGSRSSRHACVHRADIQTHGIRNEVLFIYPAVRKPSRSVPSREHTLRRYKTVALAAEADWLPAERHPRQCPRGLGILGSNTAYIYSECPEARLDGGCTHLTKDWKLK